MDALPGFDPLAELAALDAAGGFVSRHVGLGETEVAVMLRRIGASKTLEGLIGRIVPAAIRSTEAMRLPEPLDEAGVIAELAGLAAQNVVKRSLIGQGYHGTHTPAVIQRNVLENPGWYTAYTPYQAEIAQGRLEALLNFQTVITELTGMAVANASLLDEATAAAEAVAMAHAVGRTRSDDGGGLCHRPAPADPRRARHPRRRRWAGRLLETSSAGRPGRHRRCQRRSPWCCSIPAPPAPCATCRRGDQRRARGRARWPSSPPTCSPWCC